jgi:hypothetical protein
MPYKISACSGKPYRPSNGTEGRMFMERFCKRCENDSEAHRCTTLGDALCYQIEHANYPKEWTHTEDGEPTCTLFTASLSENEKGEIDG